MFQITLTHSHCINNVKSSDPDGHFEGVCDIRSEEIGRRLHWLILNKIKAPSKLIFSSQNRSVVDDNREHSLELNTELHRTAIRNIDKTLAILDVHSFYKDAFSIIPQKELDGSPNDSCLVIFSLRENDVNERLYRFLKNKKGHKNIALIKSPDIVFVLKYYTDELKVPTFMLEFAEFFKVSNELLADIAEYLDVHFYRQYLILKKKN